MNEVTVLALSGYADESPSPPPLCWRPAEWFTAHLV